jgi:hypothetical protein
MGRSSPTELVEQFLLQGRNRCLLYARLKGSSDLRKQRPRLSLSAEQNQITSAKTRIVPEYLFD